MNTQESEDRFDWTAYLEKGYDFKFTEEDLNEFESSEPFEYYMADELKQFGWNSDTACRELLCNAYEKWLVNKALEVSITTRHDRMMHSLTEDLIQYGNIAMYADSEKSNQAIDKAMRVKLALQMLRQGAPRGLTINCRNDYF